MFGLIHSSLVNSVIFVLLLSLVLSSCSRVESRNRDTNEIRMIVDVEVDGELNETRFVLDLIDATSNPGFGIPAARIKLTRRDKIFIRFAEESYQVSRHTGARFIAIVPGVRSGEYSIDFDRQKHISAPDTTVNITSYPLLLAPLDEAIYSLDEQIELVWETRNDSGVVTDIVRHTKWGVREARCFDDSGADLIEYDRESIPIRSVRVTENQFNGMQASQLVSTRHLFEEFQRLNRTEEPITNCELEIHSEGRYSDNSYHPNTDDGRTIQFTADQNLESVSFEGMNLSNTAHINISIP